MLEELAIYNFLLMAVVNGDQAGSAVQRLTELNTALPWQRCSIDIVTGVVSVHPASVTGN